MSEQTRSESAEFLNYALCRVAMAAGMSAEHAGYIADAIVFAHRQGKLNQGLGVYEAIDLVLDVGVMDPAAQTVAASKVEGRKYLLRVSYLEIYNET